MSLGIYNTLSELILEATSRYQVEDAIEKKQQIRIYYRGDEGEVSGYRNIEPYTLGLSKTGNPILRAWEIEGVTDSITPMWKTFRLDKITDWRPFPNYFYTPISDRDNAAPQYRPNGDDSMTTIYKQDSFNYGPKISRNITKAKAVDSAVAQKNGEKRNQSPPVNRSYFDEPEMEYLQEGQVPTRTQQPSSGGGLYDQMGIPGGAPSSGGQTVSAVDRIDVNSPAYATSVNNSKLPPAIVRAMLENPIPQPSGLTDISPELMEQINPNKGSAVGINMPIEEDYVPYSDDDEIDFNDIPRDVKPKPREIPRTQPNPSRMMVEHTEVGESEIRKMIAQEIAKALPIVIEQYFDKRVLKENVSFKAGDTTFSGTVSPLPKKRTKRTK